MHRLRILALAFLAVFAVAAVSAQGAMAANGKITSANGKEFTLTGTSEIVEGESEAETAAHHGFTYPGEPAFVCHGHYVGEAPGGGDLNSGAQEVTVTPTYTECKAGGLPTTEPSRFSRGLRKEDVPSSGKENLRECQHRRSTPTS